MEGSTQVANHWAVSITAGFFLNWVQLFKHNLYQTDWKKKVCKWRIMRHSISSDEAVKHRNAWFHRALLVFIYDTTEYRRWSGAWSVQSFLFIFSQSWSGGTSIPTWTRVQNILRKASLEFLKEKAWNMPSRLWLHLNSIRL